jgi:hypothetical protein
MSMSLARSFSRSEGNGVPAPIYSGSPVKRLLASLLTMVALTACASPLAKAETPQQALSAASQRASQLKSAKFDLQGHATLTLPPAMASLFNQSGSAAGTMKIDIAGNGEAQFPDRYHATINIKMGSFTVASEIIVANGQEYIKNPLTGKWEATRGTGVTDQLGQADPLSYEQFLKNVKSIKDLGDTTLNGVAAHHYQLTLDKDKLLATMEKSARTAQSAAAMKQVLDSGTIVVEVWFGKDDHLVRRVSLAMDYSANLSSLSGSMGGSSSSTTGTSAASNIHATANLVINYHDFDAPVTISIPSVG